MIHNQEAVLIYGIKFYNASFMPIKLVCPAILLLQKPQKSNDFYVLKEVWQICLTNLNRP